MFHFCRIRHLLLADSGRMSAQASGRGQVTTAPPTVQHRERAEDPVPDRGSWFPETRGSFLDGRDRILCYAEQGIRSSGPRKYWAAGPREPPDWPEIDEIPCKFPVNGPGHHRRKVRNGLRGPPFWNKARVKTQPTC